MEPITNLISSNSLAGGRGAMVTYEVIYPAAHNVPLIGIIVIAGIVVFGMWLWFSRRKTSS
jgi:hypothetical protein